MTNGLKVDQADVAELADQFGLAIDGEVERIAKLVNDLLDDLDSGGGLPHRSDPLEATERTWSYPSNDEDPNNAIVTWCRVSPDTDGSGELKGVSVGIKDTVAVAGVPMTCGSDVMEGYVPNQDAVVVHRLRHAGATVRAKTNLDELGSAGQGANAIGGPVSNPFDPRRTAGGSSGGSAAAVAAGLVDVGIGGDTGGSIRIPASYCGIVGLKPSYGLIPASGAMENTYPIDHLGPIATSVFDIARVLEATAGNEPTDPMSMQAAGRDDYTVGGYVDAVRDPRPLTDLSVGILTNSFNDSTTPSVAMRTQDVIESLTDTGLTTKPVSIEGFEHARAIKNTLTFIDHAAHWRDHGAPFRRGGIVEESYQAAFSRGIADSSQSLNAQLKARILSGAALIQKVQGTPYTRSIVEMERLRSEVDRILSEVDALVTPTTPTVAPRLSDLPPTFDYAQNVRIANLTGHPAMTLPSGTVDGMPVGIQLVGRAFEESLLLEAGARIQDVVGVGIMPDQER